MHSSIPRDYTVSFQVSIVSYLGECLKEPCLVVAKNDDTFESLLKRIYNSLEWNNPKCECSDPRTRGFCSVALSMRISDISKRHGFTVIKYTINPIHNSDQQQQCNIHEDTLNPDDTAFSSLDQTPLRASFSSNLNHPTYHAGMRHRYSSGDFLFSGSTIGMGPSTPNNSSTSLLNSGGQDSSSRKHFLRVTDSTAEEGSAGPNGVPPMMKNSPPPKSKRTMKGGYYEKLAIVSRYKRFRKRKSALNALMENDMAPLYFIALTGLIVLMTATLADDLINSSVGLWSSIELIAWNFKDLSLTLQLWLAMQVYVYCSLLPIHLYWEHIVGGRNTSESLNPSLLISLTSLMLGPLLYYPGVWCFDHDLPFSCAMIIVCEQVRFLLKSSAFVIEHWRTHVWLLEYLTAQESSDTNNMNNNDNDNNTTNNDSKVDDSSVDVSSMENEDDGDEIGNISDSNKKNATNEEDDEKAIPLSNDQQQQQQSPLLSSPSRIVPNNTARTLTSVFDVDIYNVEAMDDSPVPPYLVKLKLGSTNIFITLTYFLFAPTLVYRTRYPRTGRVDWLHALTNLRDVFLTMAFVWVIFVRFCIPVYKQSIESPGDFHQLFSEFVNCSVPGLLLLVVGFYGVLHCWMNFWAEILTFADREFYKDWWNSRSFAQYYRRWNCVVHDWIYNYMYLPALENGCGKNVSMLIVFMTSAIIHEYVLFLALKFFYPVLLILFGGVGVFFIPLTSMYKNAKGWNTFMWSNLLIGQGMLVVLYSREWFAQYDENALKYIDVNSAIPRSWQLIRYHYAQNSPQ